MLILPTEMRTALRLLRFYGTFIVRWLRYYHSALTIYDLHSPLAVTFHQAVLRRRTPAKPLRKIERLRRQLLQDREFIPITDFGAGSQANPAPQRTVRNIARFAPVSPRFGRYLYRLITYRKPAVVVELGTSLGLSTAYLTMGLPAGGQVHTLEGCPATLARARNHFQQLSLSEFIHTYQGSFREQLPQVLATLPQVDVVFIDGDHRLGATQEYVGQISHKAHAQTVLILADIHWSAAMEEAWTTVMALPQVSLTIDLFHLGICFFDPALREKQHLALVPHWWWKPWRIGLFTS